MLVITELSTAGFSFGEVGCIRTRNKVTCCHFSSDGKLLASAGHDKKVRGCGKHDNGKRLTWQKVEEVGISCLT